jgi:hypothetical protein
MQMKKEYIWGPLWAFFGFFLLDLIGIHNMSIKFALIFVGFIVGVAIQMTLEKKKKQ